MIPFIVGISYCEVLFITFPYEHIVRKSIVIGSKTKVRPVE